MVVLWLLFPLRVLGLSTESAALVRPQGDLGTPTLSAKGALWPYGLLSTHCQFIRRMLLFDVVLLCVDAAYLFNNMRLGKESVPENG